MDLYMPLDCAVTLCDFKLNKTCKCNLRLNKDIYLPNNFAEFESKERNSLETDELEIKRNVRCPRAKRRVVHDVKSKKNFKEISADSESETEVKKKVVKVQSDSKGPKRKVVNGFKSKNNYNKTESDLERELSAYEQMIKKRCQENMEFLQSIKIDEVKASFSEAMSHVMTKRVYQKKLYETERKNPRKSKRLKNCHFEFEERKMFLNIEKTALTQKSKRQRNQEKRLKTEERERNARKEIEILSTPLSFEATIRRDSRYESSLRDIDIQEPKANDEFCLYDKSVLESMALNKVSDIFVSASTTTMSWYPSSDCLILAAGCKGGNIAIWNVCLQSCPLFMQIHKNADISHSQFSPYNQANLIFSSLDGTVFCADLIQQTFSKVCRLNESCNYFDYYSASTYLIALSSGEVAIVDKRIDEKTGMSLHTCSPSSIETISNHPVNRNLFLTAHNTKCKLWDLRKLENEPIAQNYQRECLRSAFFSPNTGKYILATYRRKHVRMFNFGNTYFENCIELRRTLYPPLNRDEFSSTATWLPNSEETFSTRHGGYVEGINIYDADMQNYTYLPTPYKYYQFNKDSFHPKRPVLACSHSRGPWRISVYLTE